MSYKDLVHLRIFCLQSISLKIVFFSLFESFHPMFAKRLLFQSSLNLYTTACKENRGESPSQTSCRLLLMYEVFCLCSGCKRICGKQISRFISPRSGSRPCQRGRSRCGEGERLLRKSPAVCHSKSRYNYDT